MKVGKFRMDIFDNLYTSFFYDIKGFATYVIIFLVVIFAICLITRVVKIIAAIKHTKNIGKSGKITPAEIEKLGIKEKFNSEEDYNKWVEYRNKTIKNAKFEATGTIIESITVVIVVGFMIIALSALTLGINKVATVTNLESLIEEYTIAIENYNIYNSDGFIDKCTPYEIVQINNEITELNRVVEDIKMIAENPNNEAIISNSVYGLVESWEPLELFDIEEANQGLVETLYDILGFDTTEIEEPVIK